jgi:hypothetical protein
MFLSVEPWDRTLAANVATIARDVGGGVDWSLVRSMKSFLSNASMSCSREASGVVVVVVDLGRASRWALAHP